MAPTAIASPAAPTPEVSIKSKASSPSTPPSAPPHPLDALYPEEHKLVVDIVRRSRPDSQLWFKTIQRREPPKALLAPWLDAWHLDPTNPPAPLPRKAEVLYVVVGTDNVFESIVDIDNKVEESTIQVEKCHKTNLDLGELEKFERQILSAPAVKKALEELGLPADEPIAADPWIYGSDTFEDEPTYIQFMMYLKPNPDGDCFHYAYPLPFVPVIDAISGEVVRIDWVYTGDSADGMKHTWKENWKKENFKPNEYMPHLQTDYKQRDVKPYIVQQPEGPSFTVDGQRIQWQNWDMRISWNAREGLVLHDVRYDGRSLFYRLSLSDMTVPYGDPRPPLHRKQAFDLGDAGAGVTANSLSLGCDCLGSIKYFDGRIALPDGGQLNQKNVVCLHEQDDGIGMKHTNYRTENPYVVRNRILVLQTIITVANYEYLFNWKFDQSGVITYETRATGVLSVSAIDPGKVSPYGNVVAPGVLATNHQHIFCLRIDPRLDGDENSLHYEDSLPMPFSTEEDKKLNPYGTGYYVEKTTLKQEGFADLDPTKSRVFKITNPTRINPISGKPRGYKIHMPATQMLLAHPDSVAASRAEFAQHHVWVTKYRDDELWCAGKYTNQSRGKAGGLGQIVKNRASTDSTDIVVWLNFGLTHNPTVEQFPIMWHETLMVSLRPADFFTYNPALDLPLSTQSFNKSVLVEQGDERPAEEGKASCCSK
ncbi:hypothetical protein IE53DRAFT_340355 [Violaceomyces palustris]|uniref:Uncharacterized protein n=1 Tax=Violaceomyces palustris TaxID=1673888 RepID=A0ACD0P3F4_9BASI|nr:hypothetical protein IE53DRAFT_340355 [Violaceomyces palustris]